MFLVRPDIPRVCIIILNWNGLKDTLECLESIFNLDYSNFEVIVVDNGSIDNSAKVLRVKYPQAIVIENKENLGFTGGNNIGMRYGLENGAHYVWLVNNDLIVEPCTLNKLVTAAESDGKIGLVSPAIYYYEERDKIQFCGSYADLNNKKIVNLAGKGLCVKGDFTNGGNICLWGTALLIKRNLIDKIGYLDEEFFAYYEDTDYSMRSIKSGFRNLVVLHAKVYHKNQSTDAKVSKRNVHFYHLMARNEYLLWNKYLAGFGKILYLRIYSAKVIESAAIYGSYLGDEFKDAWLNGSWSGIRKKYGPVNDNLRMPPTLKKIISWHPYLWVILLRGEVKSMISAALKRWVLRSK